MRTRPIALAALALATVGCAPAVMQPRALIGDQTRLEQDEVLCRQETFGYAFIPDLGLTSGIMKNRCMRERGWSKDPKTLAGWYWFGIGTDQ